MLKKFYWPLLYSRNRWEKIIFIKNFQPIRFREKIKFNSSTFSPLKSTNVWTLMLKKFYWPLLYSRNRDKKFFFIKIFRPIRFQGKIKFNYSTSSPLELTDDWTVMLKKFYWPCCILQIGEKTIFFITIFQPIRNREKNQIQLMHFLTIGIDGGVNSELDKIYFGFCLKSHVEFVQSEVF